MIGATYPMSGANAQIGVDATHAMNTALDIINNVLLGGMKVVGIMSTYKADALVAADAVIGKLAQLRIASNGQGRLAVDLG